MKSPNLSRALKRLASVLLATSLGGALGATDSIRLGVSINDHQESLIFDTDDTAPLFIYRSIAEKLRLSSSAPPTGESQTGNLAAGLSEPCRVTMLGCTEKNIRLCVVASPEHVEPEAAGYVGWPVFKAEILSFHAAGNLERVKIEKSVPAGVSDWLKLRVANAAVLMLDVPDGRRTPIRVGVDTADSGGVVLNGQKWQEWTRTHPHLAATLSAVALGDSGPIVGREVWAEEIRIGDLTLHNVPVIAGPPIEFSSFSPGTSVIFGMAALRKLDLVVDPKEGDGYARASGTSTLSYEHNRLGAVFVPDNFQSPDLVAHVAAGSPAAEGGIRNGDVLLKVDDLDVTKWRTQPGIFPLSRYWFQPAGTKLNLTIKRAGAIAVSAVTLRDILGPGEAPSHAGVARAASIVTGALSASEGSQTWTSEVVELPAFRMTSFFDCFVVLKNGTQIVRFARVTWVGPGLKQLGLRSGDFFTSIDGKPIYQMPSDTFTNEVQSFNLSPGQKKTIVFNGTRGLFRKKWSLNVTITGVVDKGFKLSQTPAISTTVTPAAEP